MLVQINRILKPGGVVVVTFSNRCFPTKAVRVWRVGSDRNHLDLVTSYLDAAGDFEEIRGGLTNSETSPPDDPLFLVTSRKVGGSTPETGPETA